MEVLIDNCDRSILLVLKFKVFGAVRFLSHAETLRMFQRACTRADLDAVYSQGFNPHMKISLPLPRTVGLACEDETCCVPLNYDDSFDAGQLKEKLAGKMPDGIEIFEAMLTEKDTSFHSGSAVYVFPVSACEDDLEKKAYEILAKDSIVLQRPSGKGKKSKSVDVRSFIESIKIDGLKLVVNTGFGPNGSIRVEEMLGLLGLKIKNLDGAVTRTRVLWNDMTNARN